MYESLSSVLGMNKFGRKNPCGENAWKIIRLGADIRIKCQGCGQSVMMPRREFEKKMKKIIQPADNN